MPAFHLSKETSYKTISFDMWGCIRKKREVNDWNLEATENSKLVSFVSKFGP